MEKFYLLQVIKFFSIILCLCIFGCEKESNAPIEQEKHSFSGDIELLNSCGTAGVASKMRKYLRKQGFDVVSFGNGRLQNMNETIIVLRNPDWEGANALANALNTQNIITVKNKRATVDVTVYIGKDYQQILEPEQTEEQ